MPVPGDYFGNDTSKFRCPLAEHIGSELMPIRRAKTFTLKPGDIALIGMPFDDHSSFLKGPAKAPPLIIEAIESDSANYFTEDYDGFSGSFGCLLVG